jgi:hypothetical protein
MSRFGHTAVVMDSQMYVFAGRAMNGLYLNDMFSIDLGKILSCLYVRTIPNYQVDDPRKLTFVPQTHQPPVRMGHSACAYQDAIIM